jgi:hypothetical protein
MPNIQTRSYWKNGALNFFDDQLDTTWKTGVWADCPLLSIRCNPQIAYECFEDFTNNDAATMAGYTVTQATTGTFAMGSEVGGTALADSNSTTQHQGVNVQKLGPCFTPAANKDLWFECRFKVVDTYDKCELFVGLAGVDNTLSPNGNLDAANTEYIGFGIETGGAGTMSFYECKATAELKDATSAIAEATYIQVGFKVTGITAIAAYVNGAAITLTNVVASGIPVTDVMTPSFVCQTDGTNDPILHIDWYRVIQLR